MARRFVPAAQRASGSSGEVEWKASDIEALSPFGFVTVRRVLPMTLAGVVAVIVCASTILTFVAGTPSNVTVAPATEALPLIVTLVPPSVVPQRGVRPVMAMRPSTTVSDGPIDDTWPPAFQTSALYEPGASVFGT